jgi:hypothetical protein
MGLWLLQESLRTWGSPDLGELLHAAEQVPPFRSLVNPDAPQFLPPGDMPARIAGCGLPVIAGPAEATTIGNILIQARTHGLVTNLTAMRSLVARTQQLRQYEPTGDTSGNQTAWAKAATRVGLP